jgi:glutamyl-tRNA synthetase
LDIVADVEIWHNICNNEVEPIMEDKELNSVAADLLPPEPWNNDTFNAWLNEVKAKTGKKGKELFHPIRKALTALDNGPELKTLLPLIGYDKAYKRLKGQKA